jgi:signal peptide peptidase SppA
VRYDRIVAAFQGQILAILPEKYEEIRAFLALKIAGGEVSAEELAAVAGTRRPDGVVQYGPVALVPVFGTIAQRVGMLGAASGGVSAEGIGARLDALVADHTVKSIVLDIDSPGGSVYGVPELAAKIRDLRGQKQIVAVADSIAASAAYWLLSQASESSVAPSGQVGSIGVIAAHTDMSRAERLEGMRTTLVTSSPHKAEGSPYDALSDEAREEMQKKVDAYHAMFVADVAAGRGTSAKRVEADFGQGRMVMAADAVAAGMVDRVETREQLLERLGADVQASPGPARGGSVPRAAVAARARAVSLD